MTPSIVCRLDPSLTPSLDFSYMTGSHLQVLEHFLNDIHRLTLISLERLECGEMNITK